MKYTEPASEAMSLLKQVSPRRMARLAVLASIALAILSFMFYSGRMSSIDPDLTVGILFALGLTTVLGSFSAVWKSLKAARRVCEPCARRHVDDNKPRSNRLNLI